MTEEEKQVLQQQLVESAAYLAKITATEEQNRREIHRIRDDVCARIAEQQTYEQEHRQKEAQRHAETVSEQTRKMKAAMEKGDAKELERLLKEMI